MKISVLVAVLLFSASALGQIKWYKFDKRFIEQHYQQDATEMRHEPDGHVESGRGANAGPKDFIASLNLTGELPKSFPCAARDFQKPGQRRAVQSFPSPRFPQDACT
jgi:hypothetical protein